MSLSSPTGTCIQGVKKIFSIPACHSDKLFSHFACSSILNMCLDKYDWVRNWLGGLVLAHWASLTDVLWGSSRVPKSANLSGKNVDQSQQTSRSGKRTLDLAKCRTWIPDNLHVISSWYLRTMGKEFIFQFSRRKWNRNAWRTPEKVYVGGVLYHWTSKHEKLLAQQKIVFPRWPNKTFLDTVNK